MLRLLLDGLHRFAAGLAAAPLRRVARPTPAVALAFAALMLAVSTIDPTPAVAAPRKMARKAPPPAPTPPAMRLGDAVRPLAYEAELTVIPTQERFSGHLVIHVEIAKPTDLFWLNATRLDVRVANVVANGRTYPARTVAGGREFVGLRFTTPLPAGRAVITLDYDGVIDRTETAGIFKQQDGADWYAYTQFESTDARRAFPCFDEPGWKTPWHLTLVVPAAAVAVSNMPIASEEAVAAAPPEPVPARRGAPIVVAPPALAVKRVRFAPTPPLPTYLVAFAVGPFDVVDGGRAGRKGTPLRYVVPRGHANELAFARDATPRLLDQLETYFGQPYPYEKLDAVGVPETVGFGAMENVGMITYRLPLMASRPEQDTEQFRRDYAETAAHEMAHQWFGDLVTMAWWNDTWLNESFATWMSAKVVERAFPTWQTRLSGDERRRDAIRIDRLATTRQVRQPIDTADDLHNIFDAITYEKGAAVLSMFETAIGEERFRNGVRRYLSEHANGNARAEDFFAAVTMEAGPANAGIGAALRSFVEQPGVPRLAVSLDCGVDGRAPPKLVLNQSRYLPSRPIGDAAQGQKWSFPACFQFGRGGDFNELCTSLQEPRTVLPLPAGESCPAWVLPNRGGSGYFVSSLTSDLLAQLIRTPLLPSEAVPALDDTAILVASGEWPVDLALDFAGRLAANRQSAVTKAAADVAREVRTAWLDDPVDREGYARWVQKSFGARARALGWLPRNGDRDGDQTLRERLVPWVADFGTDAALQRDAYRLARDWLAARNPFPAGARTVLAAATRLAQGASGRELLDAGLEALPRTSGADRHALLYALGSFRDPTLADAAYDALFSDRFDARDGLSAMQQGARWDDGAAAQAVRYVHAHYDVVLRRIPENAGGTLPRLGARLCDAPSKATFDAAFADRAGQLPGGARNYAQASEQIGICIGARQLQRAALKAYVAKQ